MKAETEISLVKTSTASPLTTTPSPVSSWQRYWRFNFVGILGFLLQLAVLTALTRLFALPYLVATILAVESALLHNFAWHERYTWHDRGDPTLRLRLRRLVMFHAANGVVSLGGNLLLMWLLVGMFAWNVLLANTVSVIACSIVNFYLGDAKVFRMPPVLE